MNAQNLKDLLAQMKSGALDNEDWSDLPTFGGKEPLNTMGIWSWDETHVIYGTCANDVTIDCRENVNVDTDGHTAAD